MASWSRFLFLLPGADFSWGEVASITNEDALGFLNFRCAAKSFVYALRRPDGAHDCCHRTADAGSLAERPKAGGLHTLGNTAQGRMVCMIGKIAHTVQDDEAAADFTHCATCVGVCVWKYVCVCVCVCVCLFVWATV